LLAASGEQPAQPPPEEEVNDEPPSTQIVLSGWGQRRTNGLIGMLGLWGKCYISLIGEDLFIFKDMRFVSLPLPPLLTLTFWLQDRQHPI
jgi:hypothetical protein